MPEETTALDTQETANAEDAPESAVNENPAAEGSRTYTQEEFEAALETAVKERTAGAVRERVDRANKQRKELANERAELAQQVESLTARVAEFEHKEQLRELAKKISEETGVPSDVLRGDTEEELRIHAESLKAIINKPSIPYVGSDGFAATKEQQKDSDWLRTAITKR